MSEAKIVYLMGLLITTLITLLILSLYDWLAVVLLGLFAAGVGMAAIGRTAMLEEKEEGRCHYPS